MKTYVWVGSVPADSRRENECCMQHKRSMISVLHVTHWREGDSGRLAAHYLSPVSY